MRNIDKTKVLKRLQDIYGEESENERIIWERFIWFTKE